MLIGRKQLIAVVAFACFLLAPKELQAGGKYTPCIVPPVFIRPLLSKPVISKAEILPATIAKPESLRWAFEHADIELPTLVQAVFSEARFDGCSEQSTRRLYVSDYGVTTIEGQPLLPMRSKSAASRIMSSGADSCCGN